MANRKRHKLNRALFFSPNIARLPPSFFLPSSPQPTRKRREEKVKRGEEKKRDCAAGGWVGYEVWVCVCVGGSSLSSLSSEAKQEVASEAVKGRRSYLRTNRMHQAVAVALSDEDQLCANV